MDEILKFARGGIVTILVLGFIPHVIWVVYAAVKKRWRLLGIQIVVPILLCLLFFAVSWILSIGAKERYVSGICGVEAELGEPIFAHDSERSVNGDGYSFTVYKLPDLVRVRFDSANDEFLSEYPKLPAYRDRWYFKRWRKSPFDDRFEKYLTFALSAYDADDEPELRDHYEAIRSALKEKGSFYAFFYSRRSEYVGDIDFFVIDLNEGRLYQINHNT